jgi:uncharacterized protein (DUF2141 family)
MTKLHKILLLTLLNSVALSCLASAEIEFHIEGVKQGDGKLLVELFKGEDNYNKGNSIAGTTISAKSETVIVKFSDIDPGQYALRFFHDENNNDQMETNFFGIPSEGYGFSNNAKPNFGPVSFSQMALTVTEQDSVVINKTQVIY